MAKYTETASFSRMAISTARSKLDRLRALSAGVSSDVSMKGFSLLSEDPARVCDVVIFGGTHGVDGLIQAGGWRGTGDVS